MVLIEKVPVEEAINKNDFIHFGYFQDDDDETGLDYGIRPLSFDRVDMNEVDEPEKIEFLEGVLWLLQFKAVNLEKKRFDAYIVRNDLVLLDQNDNEFHAFIDDHLTYESNFAKKYKLNSLASWSSVPSLSPLIPRNTALVFNLPDLEGQVYSLSNESRSIFSNESP